MKADEIITGKRKISMIDKNAYLRQNKKGIDFDFVGDYFVEKKKGKWTKKRFK